MQKRETRKHGLEVSAIGLGCMGLSSSDTGRHRQRRSDQR